ncbi:MAG: preprotein translocase subunit SecA [Candidatus Melainabacteria bacterium RIFCSPLOWO2_12_FULL_35_11]|nr:MAG: preprotein translocase subunit SecA [Candidatus Melainabacteria bacterium RIFCSPLOWO2_12_FULL_35_11]
MYMLKLLEKLFGENNEAKVKAVQPLLEKINSLESEVSKLTDDELKAKTPYFKNIIDNKLKGVEDKLLVAEDTPKIPGIIRTARDKATFEVLGEILPEAFALVREVSKRVLNMRHFDVQLMGGIVLHEGKIAEMKTGEGKTLVATLPVYLNALCRRGVHVVTVNDYLVKRDAAWMGKIYNFLGMSVGLVIPHQKKAEKLLSYKADITYGTNNEFGFDYLRDNMETNLKNCVQRDYFYAIVDEVDSILIDEARTPLIISGMPTRSQREIYITMAKLSLRLKRGKDKDDQNCDYWVDEKARNVVFTDSGIKNAEKLLGIDDLWDIRANLAHNLLQALKAKELFKRDTDYVIKPNPENNNKLEVVIVDEFTGRLMMGRRWSDGLHQAIEAKESVPIQEETLTLASITFQNLFRLYPKLAGMTGTAYTEKDEFRKIYNLDVVTIPTNKKNIREDIDDQVYRTEKYKFYSCIEEIVTTHLSGRPVLVGTVSIEKSELISEMLSKPQTMTKVMQENAQRVLRILKERKINNEQTEKLVKLLDRPGNLKDADIKPIIEQLKNTYKDSELEFILDRFESSVVVVEAVRNKIPHNVLNAKNHEKEAYIVAQAGRFGTITIATNMAGRGTDIILGGNPEYLTAEAVMKFKLDQNSQEYKDKWKELFRKFKDECEQEHEKVVELGGLHIIGTERHESRRIDNQLRGRAARQGDPGSTKFFLSLEDNLMRIFGGEKISQIMTFLKAEEDLPIEAKMVTTAVEGAQKRVEAHNFDLRKHVLQYDDVMNTQREVIYRERRRILEGADITDSILEMIDIHMQNILYAHINPETPSESWQDEALPNLYKALRADFPVLNNTVTIESLNSGSFNELKEILNQAGLDAYSIKQKDLGPENIKEIERQIMLHVIDSKWVDHLHNMDALRDGIHLRGYGQKDPLMEYKKEAFDMFEQLLIDVKREAVVLLMHAQIEAVEGNSEQGEENQEDEEIRV